MFVLIAVFSLGELGHPTPSHLRPIRVLGVLGVFLVLRAAFSVTRNASCPEPRHVNRQSVNLSGLNNAKPCVPMLFCFSAFLQTSSSWYWQRFHRQYLWRPVNCAIHCDLPSLNGSIPEPPPFHFYSMHRTLASVRSSGDSIPSLYDL